MMCSCSRPRHHLPVHDMTETRRILKEARKKIDGWLALDGCTWKDTAEDGDPSLRQELLRQAIDDVIEEELA